MMMHYKKFRNGNNESKDISYRILGLHQTLKFLQYPIPSINTHKDRYKHALPFYKDIIFLH